MPTRIVWITLLAMADQHGIAEGSVPGLATFARVSIDDCRRALEALSSPDPDSRSKEQDGRRIEPADGGWRLINHAKYREKMNADERREYLRIKQAEHRAKKTARQQPVNTRKQKSTQSTHAEAEADQDLADSYIPSRSNIPSNTDAVPARLGINGLSVVPPVWGHRAARGARAGGLVGDHRKCQPSAADACGRGVCVPGFLAREWVQQFEDYAEGEAHVTAFVGRVLARLPDGPIGDEPLKFWRAEWSAEHGTKARTTATPGRGAQTVAAMQRAVTQHLARKALKGKS